MKDPEYIEYLFSFSLDTKGVLFLFLTFFLKCIDLRLFVVAVVLLNFCANKRREHNKGKIAENNICGTVYMCKEQIVG